MNEDWFLHSYEYNLCKQIHAGEISNLPPKSFLIAYFRNFNIDGLKPEWVNFINESVQILEKSLIN